MHPQNKKKKNTATTGGSPLPLGASSRVELPAAAAAAPRLQEEGGGRARGDGSEGEREEGERGVEGTPGFKGKAIKRWVVGGGSRHVSAPLKYRPLETELPGECKISIGQADPVK